jgi:hypothetical protein
VKAAFLPVLWISVACAPRGPEKTLDEYREAVRNKDARAVHALSDESFRAAFDEAAVEAELSSAPVLGAVRGKDERAIYVLEDGSTIELVLEQGAWKVASGGVSPGRFDTPERALETFFRAALGGKLSLVRRAIPERDRGGLATDEALAKHLADNSDRIARAREKIGGLKERRAQVRGERAELSYGPGLSVTFEKEGEGWVIVDLE